MSDAVWLALIGVVAMAVKEILDQRRATAAAGKAEAVRKQAETAASAVEQVRVQADELKTKQEEGLATAAAKAEEVKTTLEEATVVQAERMEDLKKTGEEAKKVGQLTHDLVNSASLVQLKLYAVAARRIADLTKEPADVEAASVAEKLHREHEAKAAAATRNAEARDDKT